MNTNSASLDRLHDIIVPPPVAWWPPAPGWYWALAFLLLLAVTFAIKAFLRWQHNRYRREALAELTQLAAALRSPDQRATALLALSELLKRTALTAFPREQVASLTGRPWFAFLDRTGQKAAFGDGLGAALENAIYDPPAAATLEDQKLGEWVNLIRHWIQYHKSEIKPKAMKTTDKPSISSSASAAKPC